MFIFVLVNQITKSYYDKAFRYGLKNCCSLGGKEREPQNISFKAPFRYFLNPVPRFYQKFIDIHSDRKCFFKLVFINKKV